MSRSCSPDRTRHPLIPLLLILVAAPLFGHGTMEDPPSRVYQCRFADNPENPEDPACAAAVAFVGNPQFLYDWAGIRQGSVDGRHREFVPDGSLCSGGDSAFAGLDLGRDDWRTTTVSDRGDGHFELVYLASAPHATRDMLFYVTRQDWDPTQPLNWDDLDLINEPMNPSDPVDPFCHLTSVTLEPVDDGQGYRMVCPLPQRTGRHVIYHVWQRGDSPEAFYACIDVEFADATAIFAHDFDAGNLDGWASSTP